MPIMTSLQCVLKCLYIPLTWTFAFVFLFDAGYNGLDFNKAMDSIFTIYTDIYGLKQRNLLWTSLSRVLLYT